VVTEGYARNWSFSLRAFLYLQLLDVLTTWLGLRMGLIEVNPIVQFLIHLGSFARVLSSKAVALVIGGFCVYRRRLRVIHFANCWYAAVVIWNLAALVIIS
jgi:hypothetical protein